MSPTTFVNTKYVDVLKGSPETKRSHLAAGTSSPLSLNPTLVTPSSSKISLTGVPVCVDLVTALHGSSSLAPS